MLLQLKLTNFRQHKSTSIEFVKGVNTIVGLNNSGKSTLPEAIEFALFGARALRDTAKGFITDNETEGSAIVKLELNGDTYVVGRDSRNAEVRKNKELDARYKDNVSTYVAQLTGVNQTGFRLGHYVRQKELAAFSALRPGKRYETVERMLKVHAVDKAIKHLKEAINDLEITQKALLGSYQDVDAIENELDDLRIAVLATKKRIEDLRMDLERVSALLSSQRSVQKELLKKPELARLRSEVTRCDKAASDLQELELELNKLGVVTDEAYSTLRDKVAQLRTVEHTAIAMQAKKLELEKLNPVMPEPVEVPIKPAKDTVVILESQLNIAKQKRLAFKKLEAAGECHVCHQLLSDEVFESILQDLIKEEQVLEEKLKLSKETYEAALSEYSKEKAVYDNYTELLRNYTMENKRKETLLQEYIEVNFNPLEREALDEELIAMQTARESWVKLDERRRALIAVRDGKAILLTAIADLEYLDLVFEEPDLDSLVNSNEEIERDLNSQLNTAIAEQARVDGRTIELNRLVTQMKAVQQSITSNYNIISKNKAMQDSFVLFKRHLTAKIRPLLQQVAETLFHKTTKNRYAAFNLSSDYEITLTTHLGFIRKLATISGSENDLACLCLRLAIATLRSTKLAGSLGFIILDEISGSFDNERTKQTLEGLLELRDVIPQIINITHKEVEMKYADRLFTVKEVNGIASVTFV